MLNKKASPWEQWCFLWTQRPVNIVIFYSGDIKEYFVQSEIITWDEIVQCERRESTMWFYFCNEVLPQAKYAMGRVSWQGMIDILKSL